MKRIIPMFFAICVLAISSFAAPVSAATCCCCENANATCCCGDTCACACCKH